MKSISSGSCVTGLWPYWSTCGSINSAYVVSSACFLQSRGSPDMMVTGLRVAKTPPFNGKQFNGQMAWKTRWIVNRLGILLNGIACHMALTHSLMTLMHLSTSVTCSSLADRFSLGPWGMASISSFSGSNSPSVRTISVQKPWHRQQA